jgi:hypothetical protein
MRDVLNGSTGVYGLMHVTCAVYSQAAVPAAAAAREVECYQLAVQNLTNNDQLSRQVRQCTLGGNYFQQQDCLEEIFEPLYAVELAGKSKKIVNNDSKAGSAKGVTTRSERRVAAASEASAGNAASALQGRQAN